MDAPSSADLDAIRSALETLKASSANDDEELEETEACAPQLAPVAPQEICVVGGH